jgi:hypothetical protein
MPEQVIQEGPAHVNGFGLHPSIELVELFKNRPFQGQDPQKASIIFLSSDANYSPEISRPPFFNRILEYHRDGVAFWEEEDVHHPFLLPDYPLPRNTGGVPFHRNFSNIGLDSDYAKNISFLEILNVPTTGNKSENMPEFYRLASLCLNHLRDIENLMKNGGHKLFFVPKRVLEDNIVRIRRENNNINIFPFLDDLITRPVGSSIVLPKGNKIMTIFHFAAWQIHGQIPSIRSEIKKWLNV